MHTVGNYDNNNNVAFHLFYQQEALPVVPRSQPMSKQQQEEVWYFLRLLLRCTCTVPIAPALPAVAQLTANADW